MTEISMPESAKMGYGFTPSRKKRAYNTRSDPLEKEFLNWMEEVSLTDRYSLPTHEEQEKWIMNAYEKLSARLKQIGGMESKPPEEINSLALICQDRENFEKAGFFLSACYRLLRAKEIVFDFEKENGLLDYLGFCLPEGKSLIVKSPLGSWTGFNSKGTIINRSQIEDVVNPKGCVINFGEMNYSSNSYMGSVINYGIIKSHTSADKAINFGKIDSNIYGPVMVNLGECGQMGVLDLGINFGTADDIDRGLRGFSINCGAVKGHIGDGDKSTAKIIVVKKPDGEIRAKSMSETRKKSVLLRHTKLEPYFEAIRQRFEAYRTADYPKCLEAFQLLDFFATEEFRRVVDHVDLSL